ncbi:MAG: aspartate racemase [Paracoccaceae bacterium]|jgi:aspartate racemase
MHIGLIGGIGVAATVAYYQRLTAAMRARDAKLELTIVQADVFDLIRTSLSGLRDEQAATYAGLITRLKAAGADCAAITSLGGHFCFDETAAVSPLPMVSAVAPLDGYFAANRLGRVGLLGTEIVMRTRFFGQLSQTEAVAPQGDLVALGQVYQDMATSGLCTDAQRKVFFAEGRRMVEDQGADAIVLGGTDLDLAFGGFDPGYPVIDALDVHVELLADLASGAKILDDLNAGNTP